MAFQQGMGVGAGATVATIDESDTLILTLQYEGVTLYTDGTNSWVGD